jgi:glutathione synthase/RimK-type ligase-like ATP-grasp enzyme
VKHYDLIILTCDKYLAPSEDTPYYRNLLNEDRLVHEALSNQGLKVDRISWSNPTFDWSSTSHVLFRTTWDYHERFDEFIRWMGKVSHQTNLINSFELTQWNLDKHYLIDLQNQGIPVIPTRYIKPLSKTTLKEEISLGGWDQVVLKPAVSSTARHTYRVQPHNISNHEAVFQRLIKEECMMLQPFVTSIQTKGEISLITLGGKYSHAVLKKAKLGEFRVQDDFGGTVHEYTPTDQQIQLAEKAVAACPYKTNYARVDLVWGDDEMLWVSEIELLEPELFFRNKPEAANQLARIIHANYFAN